MPAIPYIVMAVLTIATQVYAHQQEVKMKRKQREAEAAAKEAAYAAIDVVFDTTAPQKIVYGRTRVGGVVFFENTSGTKGKYLNILQTIASHEVDAIESVWHNEILAKDFVTGQTGLSYPSYTSVWVHRGTLDQTSSAEMTDRINESQQAWGVNTHRGQGIAFIGSSLEYDTNDLAFPGAAVPTITAIVRGKKLFDPRTGETKWSDNPALVIYDMLVDLNGIDPSTINTASFIASANYCDEPLASDTILWTAPVSFTATDVALVQAENKLYFDNDAWVCSNAYVGLGVTGSGIPAGTVVTAIRSDFKKQEYTRYDPTDAYYGTVETICSGENSLTLSNALTTTASGTISFYEITTKKFTCNGVVSTEQAPCDYIQDVLDNCEGRLIQRGGEWYLYCGWQDEVGVIDERYLRDDSHAITFQQSNIADSFNCAVASFISKKDFWNATDTTPIRSQTFLDEDNGIESQLKMDYTFCDSTLQAYRLQKYELFKSRFGRVIELKCNTKALPYDHGDNVIVNLAQLGWTSDSPHFFTIIEKKVDHVKGQVDFKLRETSPTVFDQTATQDDVKHPISMLEYVGTGIEIPSEVKITLDGNILHVTWLNDGSSSYSGVRLTIKKTNAGGPVVVSVVLPPTATSYDLPVPDDNGTYYAEVNFISIDGRDGGKNWTHVINTENIFEKKVQNTGTFTTASVALSASLSANARVSSLAATLAREIQNSIDTSNNLLNEAVNNSASLALYSSSFSITETSHSNAIHTLQESVVALTSSLGSTQAGLFELSNVLVNVSGGLSAETETRKTQISSVSSSLLEKANQSTVTQLSNTVSTFSSSMASQMTAVTATSNNASANAALALNAITNANGSEANAVWRTNANGVVTGITLLSSSGSSGTISTIDFTGNLQSNGFVAGSTGWRLSGNGDLEANTGTFRGKLYAGQIATNGTTYHPDYPNIPVPASSMFSGYRGDGIASTNPSYPDYVSLVTLYGVGRRNGDSNIPAYQCFARNNMNFIFAMSGWFDLYSGQVAGLQPTYRINGGGWNNVAWSYGLGPGWNNEVLNVTWPIQVTLGMNDQIEFGVRGHGPNYQGTQVMVQWNNL